MSTGDPEADGARRAWARALAGGCDLCEAAPVTRRHFEDEVCWVADCESCGVPMVVWRRHGTEPPPAALEHMLDALSRVADEKWGSGRFRIDREMRLIPDHFHAHARRRWTP